MNNVEAILKRQSCRAFTQQPIEDEKLDELRAEIELANEEAGLHFQLFGPRDDGTGLDLSPKMFAGSPPFYLALVSPTDPIYLEKLGYYGERLVLLATRLGLGSCWVASTFDRETTRAELAEGEELQDVVPIGYAKARVPFKQRAIRFGLRSKNLLPHQLWKGKKHLAKQEMWIQACVASVQVAPSGGNGQPVRLVQEEEDGPISAKLERVKFGIEYTDLGIAKLHFEIVAKEYGKQGYWEWGDGGRYILEAEQPVDGDA